MSSAGLSPRAAYARVSRIDDAAEHWPLLPLSIDVNSGLSPPRLHQRPRARAFILFRSSGTLCRPCGLCRCAFLHHGPPRGRRCPGMFCHGFRHRVIEPLLTKATIESRFCHVGTVALHVYRPALPVARLWAHALGYRREAAPHDQIICIFPIIFR
jgi:hypothetical protein